VTRAVIFATMTPTWILLSVSNAKILTNFLIKALVWWNAQKTHGASLVRSGTNIQNKAKLFNSA